MATEPTQLLQLNDPRLRSYLVAADEHERAHELAALLTEVQALVRTVLRSYVRADWPILPDECEEVVSTVTVRVLRKLRAAATLEEESIQNLDAYVTTLSKNAVRDFMRRRWPERARLKQRLRYLILRDPRLLLSVDDGFAVCSLATWAERSRAASAAAVQTLVRETRMAVVATADDVVELLRTVGRPVRLTDLVTVTSGAVEAAEPLPEPARDFDIVESRQYLEILWSEIGELPVRQRAALLLNLREPTTGNAVALFVLTGMATMEQLAELLDFPPATLAAMWDDLPLDDLRIAELFGIRRQQVINLRKSARERLARRMRARGAGRERR